MADGDSRSESTEASVRVRGKLKLDRIDVKILDALQGDGHMSNLKLSEMVGLSPTPCLQRIRRLENAGLIASYGATLDARKLAPHIIVHTDVTLRSRTGPQTQKFERHIRDNPYVVECFLVSGGFDYVLKVVARDVDHYHEIMQDLLAAEVGIERFSNFITLRQVKMQRAFPMAILQSSADAKTRKRRFIRRG